MKFRVLILVFIALVCGPRVHAALSPEAFTQEYATKLRAAIPACKVEVLSPLKIRVTDDHGTASLNLLDNSYNDYLADPDSRDQIIEFRVAAFVDLLHAPPLDARNIVPIIKDRRWLDWIGNVPQNEGGKPKALQVYEEFNDQL